MAFTQLGGREIEERFHRESKALASELAELEAIQRDRMRDAERRRDVGPYRGEGVDPRIEDRAAREYTVRRSVERRRIVLQSLEAELRHVRARAPKPPKVSPPRREARLRTEVALLVRFVVAPFVLFLVVTLGTRGGSRTSSSAQHRHDDVAAHSRPPSPFEGPGYDPRHDPGHVEWHAEDLARNSVSATIPVAAKTAGRAGSETTTYRTWTERAPYPPF
ncbi:MAG: hypothetical protein U0169_27605 [Polyangiaceae bacterium]